jgi:histidine triad (HIT) family protein
MSCPFCNPEVIAKQTIWETEHEWVFYNLSPKTKGQCLVVPKRHVTGVRELPALEAASLLQTVQQVSEKLNTYLQPAGFNYGFNEGAIAGQTVFHLHFHIMPRYADDGVQNHHVFHRPPGEKIFLTDEEMQPLIEEFKQIF